VRRQLGVSHRAATRREDRYYKLMDRFEAGKSITAAFKAQFGGTLPVTYGVALIGVISTLYAESEWSYLGQAIQQGLQGNGDLLAELAYSYEGLGQNVSSRRRRCQPWRSTVSDSPSPRSLDFYENLAKQLTAAAPTSATPRLGLLDLCLLAVQRGRFTVPSPCSWCAQAARGGFDQ